MPKKKAATVAPPAGGPSRENNWMWKSVDYRAYGYVDFRAWISAETRAQLDALKAVTGETNAALVSRLIEAEFRRKCR